MLKKIISLILFFGIFGVGFCSNNTEDNVEFKSNNFSVDNLFSEKKPIISIDNNVRFIGENYLIFSNSSEKYDDKTIEEYFIYDFSNDQILEIGFYDISTKFLNSEQGGNYFIQKRIESYNFSNISALKTFSLGIFYFDDDIKKIERIYWDKNISDVSRLDVIVEEVLDSEFILKFNNVQYHNYDENKKPVLDYFIETYYKIENGRVLPISRLDYNILKEKNIIFENDDFLIKDDFVLDKDNDNFYKINTKYNKFCGVGEDYIFLESKTYNFSNSDRNSDSLSRYIRVYDYKKGEYLDKFLINHSCIMGDEYFYSEGFLINMDTWDKVKVNIDLNIMKLFNNKFILKDDKFIYYQKFDGKFLFKKNVKSLGITENELLEKANNYMKKIFSLYEFNDLNELYDKLEDMEDLFSKKYFVMNFKNYKEVLNDVKKLRDEYNKFVKFCEKKDLFGFQWNLCKNNLKQIDDFVDSFKSSSKSSEFLSLSFNDNYLYLNYKLSLTGKKNLENKSDLSIFILSKDESLRIESMDLKYSLYNLFLESEEFDDMLLKLKKLNEEFNEKVKSSNSINVSESFSNDFSKSQISGVSGLIISNNNKFSGQKIKFESLIILILIMIIGIIIRKIYFLKNKFEVYNIYCNHCFKIFELEIYDEDYQILKDKKSFNVECSNCCKNVLITRNTLNDNFNFEDNYCEFNDINNIKFELGIIKKMNKTKNDISIKEIIINIKKLGYSNIEKVDNVEKNQNIIILKGNFKLDFILFIIDKSKKNPEIHVEFMKKIMKKYSNYCVNNYILIKKYDKLTPASNKYCEINNLEVWNYEYIKNQ